jgi:hypothetical protein
MTSLRPALQDQRNQGHDDVRSRPAHHQRCAPHVCACVQAPLRPERSHSNPILLRTMTMNADLLA